LGSEPTAAGGGEKRGAPQSLLCGERKSQGTVGIFRLRKMEHCNTCFDEASGGGRRGTKGLCPKNIRRVPQQDTGTKKTENANRVRPPAPPLIKNHRNPTVFSLNDSINCIVCGGHLPVRKIQQNCGFWPFLVENPLYFNRKSSVIYPHSQ